MDNLQIFSILARLPLGGSVVAHGRKMKDVSTLCQRVRRGTEVYFQCKTITQGVLIRRVE